MSMYRKLRLGDNSVWLQTGNILTQLSRPEKGYEYSDTESIPYDSIDELIENNPNLHTRWKKKSFIKQKYSLKYECKRQGKTYVPLYVKKDGTYVNEHCKKKQRKIRKKRG